MPAGFNNKAGIVREATTFSKVWPSTNPGTVVQLLPVVSEDVNITLDQQSAVTRDSYPSPERLKTIRDAADGGITVNAQYVGMEQLWAYTLGHQANRLNDVLQPEEITAGLSYRHTFELDKHLKQGGWVAGSGFKAGPQPIGDGLTAGQQKIRRFTYAQFKGFSVWEVKSAMINNLTLQVSPSGVNINFSIVGYEINYSSATNAGITLLTCPVNRIRFRDCKLSIRQADASPFQPEDELSEITGFSVQIANNLQAINTKDTKTKIEEPQRSGAVTVTGGFALPRFLNLNLANFNRNQTRYRMKLECTGPLIPGTADNFKMTLWFPSVTMTGGDQPTRGPEQLQQNYSYLALPGSGAPGFPVTSFTGPIIVELINDNGDHTLLD